MRPAGSERRNKTLKWHFFCIAEIICCLTPVWCPRSTGETPDLGGFLSCLKCWNWVQVAKISNIWALVSALGPRPGWGPFGSPTFPIGTHLNHWNTRLVRYSDCNWSFTLYKNTLLGSFINYVAQLGDQPLCYTMMNMVSKMVYYELRGGGQIMFKMALRNLWRAHLRDRKRKCIICWKMLIVVHANLVIGRFKSKCYKGEIHQHETLLS